MLYVAHLEDGWRYGYFPSTEAWRLAPDVPRRLGQAVASAINKLAEVLELLGLVDAAAEAAPETVQHQQELQGENQLEQQQQEQQQEQQQQQQQQQDGPAVTPVVRWALDVGAAPGGWSSHLADSGFNVIAVDPGEDALLCAIDATHSAALHRESTCP